MNCFLLGNELFERAVTTQAWEVDKALSGGLDQVLSLLPNGKVVRKQIESFGGLDKDVPECCQSDTGLYGACSAESIRLSAEILEPFAGIDGIRLLSKQQVGGLKAIFDKSQKRAEEALRILESDDYLRNAWKELTTAISTCVDNGDYLGLGMSP